MIRRYRESDRDAVVDLFLASTIPGQDFLPPEHWQSMVPKLRESILPNAETWLVEDAGAVIAFIVVHDRVVEGIFTHPEQEGRGHGSALVEHVVGLHPTVLVELYEANQKAVAFYLSRGFEIAERRDGEIPELPKVTLRPSRNHRR